MIQVLLFIARYLWIAIIGIILIAGYLIWLLEVVADIIYCHKIFHNPIEYLETSSKIFISLHILGLILSSFIYFLYSTDVWRIIE